MSLSELSPTNLQVSAAYSFRPVVPLLDHLPSRVTFGALADEFTSLSGVLLSPSLVTFLALADEFPSPSGVLLSPSRVTPGSLAQSCHSWSTRRRIYKSQRRIAFAQSCHSWISCPVVSLLELSPTNLQVPAAYCFRPAVSLSELSPTNLQVPAAYCFRPAVSLLERSPTNLQVPAAYCFRNRSVMSFLSIPARAYFEYQPRVLQRRRLSTRARVLLFLVKKLSPAAYCFRISPAGVKKKIFFNRKAKKKLSVNTYYTLLCVCDMCTTVHNDLFFIMFSFSVSINVHPSYVHCRTVFAKVVFCFANRFPFNFSRLAISLVSFSLFSVLCSGVSSNRQDESPSIGLSLNRSQRGNCSTEYNTPPGT